MKRDGRHRRADRRYGSKTGATLLAERIRAREERAERARAYRLALEAELVATGGNPASASATALLDSAVSAHLEIAKTTQRFIHGSAHNKAMLRLQFARSELRRALRALGLIRDSGDADADDPNAPPPNATDEEKRAWSQRYVESVTTQ
jgi:hypothetical protein